MYILNSPLSFVSETFGYSLIHVETNKTFAKQLLELTARLEKLNKTNID